MLLKFNQWGMCKYLCLRTKNVFWWNIIQYIEFCYKISREFSRSFSLRRKCLTTTEKFANCSPWKISEFCFPENVIKTIVLKPIFGHYEHTYFERGQEQQCLIIFVVSLFFGFLLKIEFDWIWEKCEQNLRTSTCLLPSPSTCLSTCK